MSSCRVFLVSVLFLALCNVMQCACLPARLPAEEGMEESSRSRSAGSAAQALCNPLSAAELGQLRNKGVSDLHNIFGNMTQAKAILDMKLNESLSTGFYGGKEGNSHTQVAVSVPYFCCAVPLVLDVMRQEAVNEMLGVSSHFHAVYDILDPADSSNLPMTLKKIVTGAELNSCRVPDTSVCLPFSAESHSAVMFASILAQNLRNLSEDILFALNEVLGQ